MGGGGWGGGGGGGDIEKLMRFPNYIAKLMHSIG